MLNIAQSRLVDASQRLTFAVRSPHGIYGLSTSFAGFHQHGLSARKLKDILARVQIAIQMLAAVLTIELPNVQAHAAVNVAAEVAPLAARKEAIRNANFLPIPSGLVFQHLPEHPKAGATNVLRQSRQFDHPAHIQVLNRQHVETAHQICCELVQTILATVCNVGVEPRHLEPLAVPASTSLLASGERLLEHLEPALINNSVARITDASAVTQGCEPADAEVYAHFTTSLWKMLNGLVKAQAHEVFSITAFGYRRCGWITCEVSRPAHIKPSKLGNGEVSVVWIPLESTGCIFGRLLAVFAFESREACSLGEEVGVGGLQMPERLLQGNTGHVVQVGSLRRLLKGGEGGGTGVVVDRYTSLKAVRAETQRGVVGHADTAERLGKNPLLRLARVDSESVSDFHSQILSHSCENMSTLNPSPPKGGGFHPNL